MASSSIVSIVALVCIVSVQGFVGNSAPSYEGIYNGRFGPDNIKISAQAVFNTGGVTGSVTFSQSQPGAPVEIHVSLQGLDQYTDAYSWRIRNYPVRSSLLVDFPCSPLNLGGEFYNVGDNNGLLNYEAEWQTFYDDSISLRGHDSIIGRSLVIEREGGVDGDFVCANIEQLGARREILRAAFNNRVIQGDVIFRYALGRDDVTIEADLFRIDGDDTGSTGNTWSLHYGSVAGNNSCDNVEPAIFGSSNVAGDGHGPKFECDNMGQQRECRIGDLTSKCGALTFEADRIHTFCTDSQLGTVPRTYIVDQSSEFSLVLAIRDENMNALGCAPLEVAKPLSARTQFRGLYGFGDLYFWQTGPDDRTYVRAHITGLDRRQNHLLRIYENALTMNQMCTFEALGNVVSRQNGEFLLPGDVDSGCLGSLETIIPLQEVTSFRDTVSTNSLPLFGHNSIIGRSIALIREDDGMIVGCGTIMRQLGFPESELASLQGYQNVNNPPLPPLPAI